MSFAPWTGKTQIPSKTKFENLFIQKIFYFFPLISVNKIKVIFKENYFILLYFMLVLCSINIKENK